MNIYWMPRKKLDLIIKQKIKPSAIVLDIGCGIRPQKFQKPLIHICCEPFGQYVEELQKIKGIGLLNAFGIITKNHLSEKMDRQVCGYSS